MSSSTTVFDVESSVKAMSLLSSDKAQTFWFEQICTRLDDNGISTDSCRDCTEET